MAEKWQQKGTHLIIGDSMINRTGQRRISKKRLVTVHSFPGAKIQDMRHI